MSFTNSWRIGLKYCKSRAYASETVTFVDVHVLGSYSELSVTKVDEYGLVIHWQGSDDSLPPILLAAHQGWAFRD